MVKRKLSLLLAALTVGLPLAGCGTAEVPSSSAPVKTIETADAPVSSDDFKGNIASFSTELFKRIYAEKPGENTLLSPLSVYTALGMVTNGADGNTYSELCGVLGGSAESTSSALGGYMKNTNSGGVLQIANSMFVMERSDITMDKNFIKTVKKSYFAEIFTEPYSDDTVEHINSWVSDKTKDMIPKMLMPDDITPNTVSVLLNAIAFDGKWAKAYDPETDVREGEFENYDGTASKAQYMYSCEGSYFKTKGAEGFTKQYEPDKNGSVCCFAAFLPNEGVSVDEFVSELTPETIGECINNAGGEVLTYTPKFSFDESYSLPKELTDMGINDAFDPNSADFTRLAVSQSGNCVFIGNIIHKTHIEVDEKGTKAAAATAIIMQDNAVAVEEEPKIVELNRPFVFAIYDMTNDLPVFIGTVCRI